MVCNDLIFTGPFDGSGKLTKEASHNEQSAAVAPDTFPLRQQPFDGVKKSSGTYGEGTSTSKQSSQIGEKRTSFL